MDDDRVWEFEGGLWAGDAERYRALIDQACLMVLPTPPYILGGDAAVAKVAATPRWTNVEFEQKQIARPEEGMIVIAYLVSASREQESYSAFCSSTYRRRGHDDWQVVQHHQTVATE